MDFAPIDPLGLVGAGLGFAGSMITNAQNVKMQREQRDWQQQMANTAHQREVADLRAAGLNPILSATGGQGATTPQVAPARVENPLQDVSSNYSALQGTRLSAERLELEKTLNAVQVAQGLADVKVKEAQAYNLKTGGNLNEAETIAKSLLNANPDYVAAFIRNLQQQEKVGQSQVTSNLASAKASEWQAQGKSITDVLGKVLTSTLEQGTGSKAPSLFDIIRALVNMGPPTPAGVHTGPRLPGKGQTSAKE